MTDISGRWTHYCSVCFRFVSVAHTVHVKPAGKNTKGQNNCIKVANKSLKLWQTSDVLKLWHKSKLVSQRH